MIEAAQHIPCYHGGQIVPGNLRVVRNQSSQSVRLSTYAQLRRDPTHTTTLRNQFSRAMEKRFRELRGLIRKAIVDQDCFGLQNNPTTQALPQRRQFDFPRSQDKVSAFMDWLRKQEDQGILEIRPGQQVGEAVENAWTNQYVQSAYQKGVYRARQELVQAGYPVPGIEETGGIDQVFNQPFHMDRVGLMYTRTFNELKGITDAMDQQVSRVLSQGIAEGRNPNQIAQLLTRTISGPSGDLGLTDTLGRWVPAERRARIMARTEVIRAHHAATIQEYKNWGTEGVKVKAEWSTAGDARVCPQCAMMEGRTYTLKEAEGMVPLHPQCRCIVLPVDVTDVEEEAAEEAVEEVPQAMEESEYMSMRNLFEPQLTQLESATLSDYYKSIEYKNINGELREQAGKLGYITDTQTKRQIQHIDSAFEKALALPKDTYAFRGIDVDGYEDVFPNGIQVGDEFADFGFSLTSVKESTARYFSQGVRDGTNDSVRGTLFRIKLKQGQKAIPNDVSFEDEAEMILPRHKVVNPDKYKFRVTNIENTSSGGKIVNLEWEDGT